MHHQLTPFLWHLWLRSQCPSQLFVDQHLLPSWQQVASHPYFYNSSLACNQLHYLSLDSRHPARERNGTELSWNQPNPSAPVLPHKGAQSTVLPRPTREPSHLGFPSLHKGAHHHSAPLTSPREHKQCLPSIHHGSAASPQSKGAHPIVLLLHCSSPAAQPELQ